MKNSDCREAFEKWTDVIGLNIERDGGQYRDSDTAYAWFGFRAAWKACTPHKASEDE